MNKRKFFQFALTFVVLFLLAYYIIKNINDFKQLSIINYSFFAPVFLLSFLIIITYAFILIIAFKCFGLNLGFKKGFGLSVMASLANYLAPLGGVTTRAVYLKERYRFPYSSFLVAQAMILLAMFLTNAVLGIIVLSLIYFYYGTFNIIIFSIFSITFLFLLTILIISLNLKERKSALWNKIKGLIDHWNLAKKNRKSILLISFFVIIEFLLQASLVYLEFKIFGISISLLGACLLAVISALVALAPLTPGSLGIREVLVSFVALTLGIPIYQTLTITILDRIVLFALLLIIGPIFSYNMLKKQKDVLEENKK